MFCDCCEFNQKAKGLRVLRSNYHVLQTSRGGGASFYYRKLDTGYRIDKKKILSSVVVTYFIVIFVIQEFQNSSLLVSSCQTPESGSFLQVYKVQHDGYVDLIAMIVSIPALLFKQNGLLLEMERGNFSFSCHSCLCIQLLVCR
jgi:hypothetical protein